MISETVFIMLQVCLIASFLVIFFFSYVGRVEKEIVEKQVTYLVDNFTSAQKYYITQPQIKQLIQQTIESIQPPNLKEEDKAVNESNYKLEQQAVQIILAFMLSGIIVFLTYVLYCINNDNPQGPIKMLIVSAILLMVVALTETVFLNTIAKHYISANPNYFRQKILKELKKFSESK